MWTVVEVCCSMKYHRKHLQHVYGEIELYSGNSLSKGLNWKFKPGDCESVCDVNDIVMLVTIELFARMWLWWPICNVGDIKCILVTSRSDNFRLKWTLILTTPLVQCFLASFYYFFYYYLFYYLSPTHLVINIRHQHWFKPTNCKLQVVSYNYWTRW